MVPSRSLKSFKNMLARTRSNRLRSNKLRAGQSATFADRRRKRLVIGSITGVVALAVWVFVFSRLSYASFLQINQIDVYGEADLAPHMQAAALQALDGSYAGLFSRADTLIYPKADIVRAVASSSPRIDSVKVSRNGLHGLSISVSEKAPEAVICADLPDLTDESMPLGHSCYLADADSYLYRQATSSGADAASRMRFYIPALPDTGVLGTQATSTQEFKRLETLVRSVTDSGIHVHAMLINEDDSYELYADNPDGGSIVVIEMNEEAGLSMERDNLVAFWNKMVTDARAAGKKVAWSEIKLQYPPNVYSRPMHEAGTSTQKK